MVAGVVVLAGGLNALLRIWAIPLRGRGLVHAVRLALLLLLLLVVRDGSFVAVHALWSPGRMMTMAIYLILAIWFCLGCHALLGQRIVQRGAGFAVPTYSVCCTKLTLVPCSKSKLILRNLGLESMFSINDFTWTGSEISKRTHYFGSDTYGKGRSSDSKCETAKRLYREGGGCLVQQSRDAASARRGECHDKHGVWTCMIVYCLGVVAVCRLTVVTCRLVCSVGPRSHSCIVTLILYVSALAYLIF